MSSVYRPSTPADEAQIIALLARAFSTDSSAPFLQPDLVRWKCWEPCADWPEPRSWVVEQEERIVAHASLWPVTVGTGDQANRGISMVDWASERDSAGVGLFLAKRLMKTCAFTYIVGGTAMTQAMAPRVGFRDIGESVTWARPLRPWKRLLRNGRFDLDAVRSVPGKIVWAYTPTRSVGRRWTVAEVNAGSSDPLVPAFERGNGFFDYLDRCPRASCLRFHILNGGRKVGSFALVVGRLQARVAGAWLEDPSAENWRIAFNLAQAAALERTGALDFAARCSTEASAAGAARAGMHVAKRSRVLFRAPSGFDLPALQYQLCDNDDVFLNIL